MCKFFSSIVTRQGEILWHEATDSHEDLVHHFKLKDNNLLGKFVRTEFYPDDVNDSGDVDKYKLRVDEESTPEWFKEIEEATTEKLRAIVSRIIVKDDIEFALGGVYVLAGKAKISVLKNGRVVMMWDSSQVGKMLGSSQVGEMWDSSRVETMWGSSRVETMWDSSQVETMSGSSQIRTDNRAKK